MIKYIILAVGIFLIPFFGISQHNIEGKVLNENGEPLSYATVTLLHPVDSTLMFFGVTNPEGEYQIKNIKSGKYLMQFSLVSVETFYQEVDIPSANGENFGEQVLKATTMDEVVIEAELIPLRFKTDTVEYDVKAFKTRPGASVEELLEKLPGLEVDQAGNVKAQGEDVVKILVDGKEFFGKDPKVATKNLPAKALDKVQVFDRKSDEAAFTGIDDGVRDRTINLMLNEDHKKGYFGELGAGGGTDETYKLDGKLYRFSQTVQTALLGMYNNINEFGFTNKDNNQFGQGVKGLNKSLAGGLNLSYNGKPGNRYFLSYLGNDRKKELEEEVYTENFLKDGTYTQVRDIIETERDRPHTVDFGIRHNFSKKNRLIIDADLEASNNHLIGSSLTDSDFENQLTNRLNNQTDQTSDQLSLETKVVYISKLNGGKQQIKTSVNFDYNQNTSQIDWTNITTIFDPSSQTIIDQFRVEDSDRSNISINTTFTQKFNDIWHISAGLTAGRINNTLNREEGIFNSNGELIDSSIPLFNTEDPFLRPSIALRRGTKKSQFNVSLDGRFNRFSKTLANQLIGQPSYRYFLPSINFESTYRTGRRFNARYNTNVNMPNTTQLFPVENSLNQLSIYKGNIDLQPEYRHNLRLSWSIFDQFSFTSFFVRLNASLTNQKISWAQTLSENFIQTITPVNIDNHYQVQSSLYFSTPLRPLGLDLNINSRENWNRNIVFINELENINTNFSHSLDISLENRKKNQWFVKGGGSISLTQSQFSISETQDNVYFNTRYFANIRFTPTKKWNLQTTANIINYNSQSFNEAVSVPLLSASISYLFLKAEKASLTLRGFDLLNKYIGFRRISETNYLLQREWNTIGQYVMLSFRVRVR